MTAAGAERTKQDIIASYRGRNEGYPDLKIGAVPADAFGDTAIVSARTFGSRVDSAGRESPNRVRYVRVFARRGGRWQAVAPANAPVRAR